MSLRMPAEWEPHESVWLAWPYDKVSFGSLNEPGETLNPERLPKVEEQFVKIIKTLARSERVELLVRQPHPSPLLVKERENVRFHEADYADVWTRDYMPSFVLSSDPSPLAGEGRVRGVKWTYDAYGSKFPDLLKDNDVFYSLPRRWGGRGRGRSIEVVEPGIILEGGAIEVNGAGTLITIEQCLRKRNPNLNRADYEEIFTKYLGISKIVWLKEGIVNDHTDGHVDDVARFVAENKVVCVFEEDPNHPNFPILNEAYRRLEKEFEIVKLPMPHMSYNNGEKAPASYANFYIANKGVLVPTFNDPNDEPVLEIIRKLFPKRDIIGIDCSEIIYGGGAIHCATREQPRRTG